MGGRLMDIEYINIGICCLSAIGLPLFYYKVTRDIKQLSSHWMEEK